MNCAYCRRRYNAWPEDSCDSCGAPLDESILKEAEAEWHVHWQAFRRQIPDRPGPSLRGTEAGANRSSVG